MDHPDERQHGDALSQEGKFDDQLSFDAPFLSPSEPIRSVTKRDGHQAPFNKAKIVEAICKAAETIGSQDRDRAESLANGVTLYLNKTLRGETPTVDQVHDAVETVLIEMGHAQTALAYARHRDRRARIRRLRTGDTRAILAELNEARDVRDAQEAFDDRPLFVRTSADTLLKWDRDRIVKALVRETGIDEGVANIVALEVENQILAANVKTLTASLVRELVDAKLMEHGLEAYRRRHRRLGVPLYDAERIICGARQNPHLKGHDPEATDRVLAESVKREFALAQVFSDEVADAHRRGDIHLHALGFVDRAYAIEASPEHTTRFGMALPVMHGPTRPPKGADELVGQLLGFHAALQRHFTGPTAWSAINVFFAPFVHCMTETARRQIAQVLVYECIYRNAVGREDREPVELQLTWTVPESLRSVEAIGPGGMFSGRDYAEFEHTAQRFAWDVLDVLRSCGRAIGPAAVPVPVIMLDRDLLAAPGADQFLHHAAALPASRRPLRLRFQRQTQGRHSGPGLSWQPPSVTAHLITMNLPRVAHRAPSETAFFPELERLMQLVLTGHRQKRDFIERLLVLKELGPLGLLAAEREGQPLVDPDRMAYQVGIAGLNETVHALCGAQLHESQQAQELARRIVGQIKSLLHEAQDHHDMHLQLVQTDAVDVCQRFATLDLEYFPDAAMRVLTASLRVRDDSYTPGTQINPLNDLSPIERVRIEGLLHDRMSPRAHVYVDMHNASPEAIVTFIRKAYEHTNAHGVHLA
jgi:anaerobic ribonucleoside-triphosphate reductase